MKKLLIVSFCFITIGAMEKLPRESDTSILLTVVKLPFSILALTQEFQEILLSRNIKDSEVTTAQDILSKRRAELIDALRKRGADSEELSIIAQINTANDLLSIIEEHIPMRTK